MTKIDNESLENYLNEYLDQVGFLATRNMMGVLVNDVEGTLEYAMNDVDFLYEQGLIDEDQYACDVTCDEKFALQFLNKVLIETIKLEAEYHARSKPSQADIDSVADQRAEYMSANWPGLSSADS